MKEYYTKPSHTHADKVTNVEIRPDRGAGVWSAAELLLSALVPLFLHPSLIHLLSPLRISLSPPQGHSCLPAWPPPLTQSSQRLSEILIMDSHSLPRCRFTPHVPICGESAKQTSKHLKLHLVLLCTCARECVCMFTPHFTAAHQTLQ